MKKMLLSLLLLAGVASAQEASITAPVARPAEAKVTLRRLDVDFVRNSVDITLDVKGSGDQLIREFHASVPDSARPTATYTGLLSAIGTTRPTETGFAERRANFRVIGYLLDNGYLSGVTLIP